jgi:hypothetical protein
MYEKLILEIPCGFGIKLGSFGQLEKPFIPKN